jgi:hypothetical protein
MFFYLGFALQPEERSLACGAVWGSSLEPEAYLVIVDNGNTV